jgi:hypothetical protein
MTERNLILIHRGPEYEQDFVEIARKVRSIDRSIATNVLSYKSPSQLPQSVWSRPTLVVALINQFMLRVKRGTIIKSHTIHKIDQARIASEAGIRVPPLMPFSFGMRLDPILFGELVIIKPGDHKLTSKGRVQLFRRRRLEAMRPTDFPEDHPIFRDRRGYLVQRFIDTGPFPTYSRVLTFLGRPIYMANGALTIPRPDLSAPDSVLESANIAIQGGVPQRVWGVDDDVRDMACKVGAAFSDAPLLAIDIIREQSSGRIYFLECNPGGNTWHFSSLQPGGMKIRMLLGEAHKYRKGKALELGRRRMIEQTGAFDIAAQALVERTLACAT